MTTNVVDGVYGADSYRCLIIWADRGPGKLGKPPSTCKTTKSDHCWAKLVSQIVFKSRYFDDLIGPLPNKSQKENESHGNAIIVHVIKEFCGGPGPARLWAPPRWKLRLGVTVATAPGAARSAGQMLEVRQGLYLGGAAPVAELDHLRKAGITAVLMVDSEEPDFRAAVGVEGVRSLFVLALDKPETDLLSHLDGCVAFIGQVRAESRGVLVHCHAGVSRSVAITAFMMKTNQLTFEKAYENLQTIKPEAKMNEGFEWQLKLYQAMGYEVDTSSAIYKQYHLQKVTEKYPELQNLPQELFAVDPTTLSRGLKDEVLYKCRKYRRSLFRSSNILDHNEGSGPLAFAHKRMIPSFMLTTGSQAQCTSYFIEPVQWMESTLLGVLDGQLLCPKCNTKLVSFNWYGEQCSCGRWVTPAFQIHKNRVDEMKMLPVLGSQARKL
ncbi:LOW QUALITY PROTEIN: dual specificity protein phosphatase 12-like [Manis pentadactyla]|uniref:LOW QUALITY PROTEIN: dual specificity protein phosphatase 12-like n=1 Tax=Manis pentadactyla TaxID=143292 RepID=UPI00255C385D|nr:LOW QUALITY PROTEIN: dual specificity protein phosphatase 12-like [Manis pentadactyla]